MGNRHEQQPSSPDTEQQERESLGQDGRNTTPQSNASLTPSTQFPPGLTAKEKQQLLVDLEKREQRRLIKLYNINEDVNMVESLYTPFRPSAELGEWHWDPEMQRWWRENKTTGEIFWEPLGKAFQ